MSEGFVMMNLKYSFAWNQVKPGALVGTGRLLGGLFLLGGLALPEAWGAEEVYGMPEAGTEAVAFSGPGGMEAAEAALRGDAGLVNALAPIAREAEVRLRAVSVMAGEDRGSLVARVEELVRLVKGAEERRMDLTEEGVEALGSEWLAPLGELAREVVEEVAVWLRGIPRGEDGGAPMVVRMFFEQVEMILEEVEGGRHETAEGRELLAPMLSDALGSPGLWRLVQERPVR